MTDQEQPGEQPATHGDAGMPSAGRRPEPGPAPSGPHAPPAAGPTVRLAAPAPSREPAPSPGPAASPGSAASSEPDPGAEQAVPAGDEPPVKQPAATADDDAGTALPPVPGPPVPEPVDAGDEPTVPSLRPRPDGGETVRLQPPFFAPGTTGFPRVPAAPEPGPEAFDRSPARDTPGVRSRDARFAPPDAPREQPRPDPDRDESPSPSGAAPAVSPEPVSDPEAGQPVPAEEPDRVREKERKVSSAGALIWVLLALLGFTLVVQLRSNDADAGLATARQEDLVGILSDLEARDQRLQQEINGLEESQRQLTSGVAGRQAALAEAGKRADELGLLAGTLPARGPGLKIFVDPRGQPIKASQILNAVQELRGAGGEVMEIVGDNGVAVRIVASSYFVDADGGDVIVDGKRLSGPYTLWVIGVPSTMQTALQIPGGVVASVSQAGGNVTMEQRSTVEVTAVRQPTSLQYARPVS